MKNRSISFYILAMVLATGSNAQASDYVLSKDNTHVATTALKYKTKRPLLQDRLFVSQAVEAEIRRIKSELTNPKLAWMFENCFPNTLDIQCVIGKQMVRMIRLSILEIYMLCGFVIRVRKYGLMYSWLIKIQS